MIQTMRQISIVLSMFSLTGCELYISHTNPMSANAYLNKVSHFNKPMVLVQTWDFRPKLWGENYYYVVPAPAATSYWQGDYLNVFQHKIPSVKDFENSKNTWQAWQGSVFDNQSRVVAIINAGTAYHINKIITAPYSAAEVEVTIDNGQYGGTKAFFAQPSLLVPRSILREENKNSD